MYLKIPNLISLIEDEKYDKKIIKSATNQILNIIKTFKIKSITAPAFLCNEILQVLYYYDIRINFYKLDQEFNPIINENAIDTDCLYLCDYFGYPIQNNNLINLFFLNSQKPIIIDRAHSLLAGNNLSEYKFINRVNVYMIFSIRKFAPTINGSLCINHKESKEIIAFDIFQNKSNFKINYFKNFIKCSLSSTYLGKRILTTRLLNKMSQNKKGILNGYPVTLPKLNQKKTTVDYNLSKIDINNYKILNKKYINKLKDNHKKEIIGINEILLKVINPKKHKFTPINFEYGTPYGVPVILKNKLSKKEIQNEIVIPFMNKNKNCDIFLWPYNTNLKYKIENISLKSLLLFVPKRKYLF